MIVRVWGKVNGAEVEFHPLEDKPDYWEGFAPRVPGLQDIEVYAENHEGARIRLQCSVLVYWNTDTTVRLLLYPYLMALVELYETNLLHSRYTAQFKYGIPVD